MGSGPDRSWMPRRFIGMNVAPKKQAFVPNLLPLFQVCPPTRRLGLASPFRRGMRQEWGIQYIGTWRRRP